MRRHVHIVLLVAALATDLLGGRPAGSQPATDRIVTLEEPSDAILQPIADGPIARVRLRVDRARVEAAGIVEGLGGTVLLDGRGVWPQLGPYDPYAPVFTFSPCDLPQVNDLPDTQLTLRYGFEGVSRDDLPALPTEQIGLVPVESGSFVLTLGKDTKPPQLTIVSPSSGTRVQPGDEVRIVLRAEEPDNLGVWQTGVNRFELLDPDGERREEVVSRGGARACGDKVTKGEATFTYQVPRDAQPGRTLDFVAEAFDWAIPVNPSSRQPLTLVVAEDEWTGTLTSVGTVPGVHGTYESGMQAHDIVTGDFTFTVGAGGTVTGRGRATFKAETVQTTFSDGNVCTITASQSPATFDLVVRGRREGNVFRLEIRAVGTASRMATTVCTRGGGSGTSVASPLGFAAVSGTGSEDAGVDVTIPAEDGALVRERLESPGGTRATAEVEIHRRRP